VSALPLFRFAARKLIALILVLFAVSAIVYFLGRGVAPGNIGTVIVGVDGATPDTTSASTGRWRCPTSSG
jgi:hypothetical protein